MSSSSYSNLQLRVMSAVVLAVVVLALTWIGSVPFRLLAVLIASTMFYEWIAMTPGGLRIGRAIPMSTFALFMLILIWSPDALIVLGAIFVLALVAAVAAETQGQGRWVAKGFIYAALSGFALAFLRGDTQSGLVAILFLFAVVWATDIAAYFVGRFFGGPKLAPAISPGKTWSGAIGGTVGGVIAGLVTAAIAGGASHGIFIAALLLSIVSQIGDLFESSIKRQAGVKDSSHLIPGHGGVMDRVDGLVVAAVALYVIGMFAGDMNQPATGLF